MDSIQYNLENLTDLWWTIGGFQHSNSKEGSIFKVLSDAYVWPNRLWVAHGHELSTLEEEILFSQPTGFIFPDWNENITSKKIKQGIIPVFNQTIMVLDSFSALANSTLSTTVSLYAVENERQTIQWVDLFERAFGYRIEATTVAISKHKVQYFLIMEENNAVGTVILYQKEERIGVHALGIAPEFRKRKLALRAMHSILQDAKNQQMKQVHLQASEMAKPLYEQLGFHSLGQIVNYSFNSKK